MKDPIPLEHFNDALESEWKLGKVEYMTFKGAGDKEVPQWIVYPPNFDPNKKWPLVQVVHGGPHVGIMNDWSARWNLQLWAAQGYVVGCVNFHGSSGFGQEFTDSITGAMGDKPLTDLMRSTDWFEKQPWIDKDRMVAAGASYGGYMMAWLNGHTDRFKAMVCHAGVYDWHAMMASDWVRGRFRAVGAPPWGDLSIVDNQSAQRFAANFKTPTLVLHGEKDFRVPITQGLAYFNTLRQKGVPTRLVYFPDENHWVLKPNNSLLWHREVFAWLKKYAGNGPTKSVTAQESRKESAGNPTVSAPERIVQEQLDAYNRHDVEAFLKTYSSEIKLYEFPDKELSSGLDAMRKTYGKLFEREPDRKATIAKRIVQGDYVIDHEEVSGGGRNFTAVAVYRVKDGKITAVWFLK